MLTVIADPQKFSVDGNAITFGQQTVSIITNHRVIDDSTVALHAVSTPSKAIFTLGGSTYTAIAGQVVTLESHILSVGGTPATLEDQTVSAASSGIVIGGSTATYEAVAIPSEAILTLGHSITITLKSSGPLIVGSLTLSAGESVATIGNEIVRIGSGEVVVSDSTTTYTATITPSLWDYTSTTSAPPIGDAINGGLQGPWGPRTSSSSPVNTSTISVAAYTGSVGRMAIAHSLIYVTVVSFTMSTLWWFVSSGL